MVATAVASKINWKWVIIGALIIALILYIYFTGKAAGKRGKAVVIDLPKDIPGAVTTPTTQTGTITATAGDIRRISTALFDEMDGFNYSGHDYTPYEEWARLSDTGFVSVYNDFNGMNFNKGEGTLKDWLKNETFVFGSIVDEVIFPRMARLNLN